MLEAVFKKVAGLKTCNFIKKKLQHRCFLMKFSKFLEHLFLRNTSVGCFCRWEVVVFEKLAGILEQLWWSRREGNSRVLITLFRNTIFQNSQFLIAFHWRVVEYRNDSLTIFTKEAQNRCLIEIEMHLTFYSQVFWSSVCGIFEISYCMLFYFTSS